MSIDRRTLDVYDKAAAEFARDWHDQPVPTDLQDIITRFFKAGLTADIGCGSGREVGWLNASGFQAIGYDASPGLLAEARTRYPDYKFETAILPDLSEIAASSFDNVLCETVIMHLPAEAVAPSVRRLRSILKPAGILYLSWRVTEGSDLRDPQGRLYTAFDADIVREAADGMAILLDEAVISASSRKMIHRLVLRKSAA